MQRQKSIAQWNHLSIVQRHVPFACLWFQLQLGYTILCKVTDCILLKCFLLQGLLRSSRSHLAPEQMQPGNVEVLYPKASFSQWMNDLAFCPSDNFVLIIGFSGVSRNEAILPIAGTSMSTLTKIHDLSIPASLYNHPVKVPATSPCLRFCF